MRILCLMLVLTNAMSANLYAGKVAAPPKLLPYNGDGSKKNTPQSQDQAVEKVEESLASVDEKNRQDNTLTQAVGIGIKEAIRVSRLPQMNRKAEPSVKESRSGS
jgi:hypothetical protein